MHYYLRCSAVMPFCRRFWCGFDGLCGLVNIPSWKPSIFWMSLVTPHDIIHDWELITYHCRNLCNGGDIDWNGGGSHVWDKNLRRKYHFCWWNALSVLQRHFVIYWSFWASFKFFTNSIFLICFPCFCMFCFVLGGERHKIRAKIHICPHF